MWTAGTELGEGFPVVASRSDETRAKNRPHTSRNDSPAITATQTLKEDSSKRETVATTSLAPSSGDRAERRRFADPVRDARSAIGENGARFDVKWKADRDASHPFACTGGAEAMPSRAAKG